LLTNLNLPTNKINWEWFILFIGKTGFYFSKILRFNLSKKYFNSLLHFINLKNNKYIIILR
jgi:hypothetical protein